MNSPTANACHKDFDRIVAEAMKDAQYWASNYWRYEYVVHRRGGEVIVRLEKVR
jgi:hypothetical protein